MPQLGLLYVLVYLSMNMLSGSNTPLKACRHGWPRPCRRPPQPISCHLRQSILYRGAWIDVVWPQFAIVALIGSLFFGVAILRFRTVAAQSST
jgi:ABC-2 type transport system permease protein